MSSLCTFGPQRKPYFKTRSPVSILGRRPGRGGRKPVKAGNKNGKGGFRKRGGESLATWSSHQGAGGERWVDGPTTVPKQPRIRVEFGLLWSAMGDLPGTSKWVINVTKADVSKEISLGC